MTALVPEAKPCKWCGEEPEIFIEDDGSASVGCVAGICDENPAIAGDSQSKAIRRWNKMKRDS